MNIWGLNMKTLDHGALRRPTGRDFPEIALAEALREVGPIYSHGGYAAFGKRALDIGLVLLALPIALPLLLACVVALWFESGSPFYRQKRLGKDGRVFSMLKLRTMVPDAEALLQWHLARDPELRREWERDQKIKDDPRVTRLGRMMRVTSLDELPQLWNVLIGDMSLVGARPMMVDQLSIYGKADAYFALRPGITGPWQVGERNETSFADRARIDEAYCRNLSFKEDLNILFRTLGVVLRSTGY
ncbi:MAG: hypothetical protein EpisKO_31640 [Epibacterium sp.]